MASDVLRAVAATAAALVGGTFAVGFMASSISERVNQHHKKKHGEPCNKCQAIGYYKCKLCNGNGSIRWSPLYDPIFIHPCVCPTCDGFKVQRCLNCLGCGLVS